MLLERLTANPPVGAAAVSVTLQMSVPEPVIDETLQVNPPSALCAPVTVPVALPLNAMEGCALFEAFVAIVNAPVTAPAAIG